ncbi:MAG: hypothetical protein FalmKO_02180 [Falsiruegeria mediterranea]
MQRPRGVDLHQLLDRRRDRTKAKPQGPRQLLTLLRQNKVATAAINKRDPQMLFELLKVLTYGSMANIQNLARFDHVSFYCKGIQSA